MKINKEFFKSMLEYDKILHFLCGVLVAIAVAGIFFKWDASSETAIVQGFEGFIGPCLLALAKKLVISSEALNLMLRIGLPL